MNYRVVDPILEITDPIPNIYELFQNFNFMFFENRLQSVTVDWSKTMKTAAGVCSYDTRAKFCQIALSEPLLKLRPRRDLVETLIHEMIHAYLFVTENDIDRSGHGPNFKGIMKRINAKTGANITVYHNFHDEVNHYKSNWYRCNGPCQHQPPLFGFVKGKLDRGPCSKDSWYAKHRATCGGTFLKSLVAPSKSLVHKETKNNKRKTSQKKLKITDGKLIIDPVNKENDFPKDRDKDSGLSDIKGKITPKINQVNFVPFSGIGQKLGENTSQVLSNNKNIKPLLTNFVPFSGIGTKLGESGSLKIKNIGKRKYPENDTSAFDSKNSSNKTDISEPINKKRFIDEPQELTELEQAIQLSIKESAIVSNKTFVEDPQELTELEQAIQLSVKELDVVSKKTFVENSQELIELERAIQLSLNSTNNQKYVEEKELTFVECPSCPNSFLLSEINDHLNICLS